ncbi:LRR receptor-like serine/threonine-protein kinase RGI2 [Manihot esculenta]|uniref:LRR receptor-like serine/threonine-protein kinase RGI2 n=1 Tax=Manihot esculenta TaxID=3983 RepID=UPI001CC41DF5|nr:LRR receptor-like serine/threonine-protein kinase RGI2 [Manihot esculenta]
MSRQLFNIYELRPMLSSFAIHYHHLFVVILALACAASATNNEVDTLISWLHSSPSSSPSSNFRSWRRCYYGRTIFMELFQERLATSFGNLSNLEELMLSNNNISGSIPPVLSNATKLLQLQLDTNEISGTIPAELGKLTQLTVFFAWENNNGCGQQQWLQRKTLKMTG